MKVLYIYVNLSMLGGIQTYIRNLMESISLHSKTITPMLLSFTPKDKELGYLKKSKIKIEILKGNYRLRDRLFLVNNTLANNFYNKVKEIDPDIIHMQYHFAHIPSITRAMKKLTEEGYIFLNSIHGFSALGCPKTFEIRRNGDFCDGIIGKKCWKCANPLDYLRAKYLNPTKVSEFIKNLNSFKVNICASEYLKAELKTLKVINTIKLHNFVSDDFLRPINSYFEIDERINPNKYYAYVGRLHETKGILELLTAYDKANENTIKLLILGEGPLKKLIEKKSTKDKNIIFLGKIENRERLIYILKNAYCLLAPSLCLENFSMSLCEASALGVPVITSNRGGNVEIIQNNYNGIILQAKNRFEIIKSLIKFFKEKKSLDEFRNKKPIFSYNSVDHIRNLENMYELLINGKSFVEIRKKIN